VIAALIAQRVYMVVTVQHRGGLLEAPHDQPGPPPSV